jgi:hypothetical protein
MKRGMICFIIFKLLNQFISHSTESSLRHLGSKPTTRLGTTPLVTATSLCVKVTFVSRDSIFPDSECSRSSNFRGACPSPRNTCLLRGNCEQAARLSICWMIGKFHASLENHRKPEFLRKICGLVRSARSASGRRETTDGIIPANQSGCGGAATLLRACCPIQTGAASPGLSSGSRPASARLWIGCPGPVEWLA